MMIVMSKKKLIIYIIAVIILAFVIIIVSSNKKTLPINSSPKGYVAIIIDDFGNNSEGTQKMLNLDIPITAAIMPSLPTSVIDAENANKNGIDIIMHIPMEPEHGKPEWLGPKAITTNLSEEEIKSRIIDGLEELKYCIGMNNHMGSKVTQDRTIMKAVLEIAKENELIFVDSKTTPKSVVKDEAQKIGVISLNRDIFLDNVKDKNYIKNQLNKLGKLALNRGYAIGIGHVGVEGGTITYESIKEMNYELTKQGIKFVSISELVKILENE